jgi:hypothetical protein
MIRRLLISVAVVLVASQVHGQTLCPDVKANRSAEGAMPISEASFTRQAAERELTKLRSLLGPDGLLVDSGVWETSFVYIEGWYLKRQALAAKKSGEPPYAVSDFCTFMKERAYVRH